MREFEQVWADIQNVLQDRKEVRTLCKGIRNDIVDVGADYVVLMSEKPVKGVRKERFIAKSDFEYVWNKLASSGVYTLEDISGVRGRRSIICAILALLDYVEGVCDRGKVKLKLKV